MERGVIDRLGPFRILSRIGRGAMSETFVGERIGPAGIAQRVCLKTLREVSADDPRAIAELRAEAQLVASLRHQNIVSLVDFGEDAGTWWMALDLIDGVDLRAVLHRFAERGERMPIDCVLYIAAELAKALRHAHGRRFADGSVGLVHRDLSPGNVMISHEGEVFLTDFGLAKVTFGIRTRTGHLKGKDAYMSPEQAIGEPLDGRSDLFALGIVLYEMLAGRRPFGGEMTFATQMQIVKGERAPLRTAAPEVPENVMTLAERLLATDRTQRVQSADELLDAIGWVGANAARRVVYAMG